MVTVQQKYLRRAKIIAKILSFAPFVRMIGLTGSLAREEASKNSDIDFFVVTRSTRLWSGRAFVSAITHLIGFRRYNDKIAGRICLNCYQTEDYLTIGPKNLKNARDYAKIKILFQVDKMAEKFARANQWIIKRGFRFQNIAPAERSGIHTAAIRWFLESLYDLIFNDWGEKYLRRYQIRRILKNPLTRSSNESQIYISNRELRFHPPKNLTKKPNSLI